MAHREGIRAYLSEVQVYDKVVDWGCGTKPVMNYLKNSDNAKFTNVDHKQYGVVNFIADICRPMSLDYANYTFAFCLEVIEHVWDSKQLIINIYNHLTKGGVLYLSQPFMYEVHKDDDRIRYTWRGLKQLLEEVGFIVEDIKATVGDLDHAEGYILRARK